jgi:hypothetical protein
MKIISSYVDSYDYLVRTKYGYDENIVYDRRYVYGKPLDHMNGIVYEHKNFLEFIGKCNSIPNIKKEFKECPLRFISITGNIFLYNTNNMQIIEQKDCEIKEIEPGSHFIWKHNLRYEKIFTQGQFNKKLFDKVHAVTGVPVFEYVKYHSWPDDEITVFERVPKIGKIKGILNLISNEVIYQNIYKFLSDLKTERVIIELDDLIKLQKKGFDKRYSFRHPVK